MRKLSFWAKQNPWKARIILVIAHTAFLLLALFTGQNLSQSGVQLPAWPLYIFLSMTLLAIFFYPSKKDKTAANRLSFYVRQKTCDVAIMVSAFCTIITISSKDVSPVYSFEPVAASSSVSPMSKKPTAAEILASLEYRDKSTLTRSEKRILKQEFKVQLKKYAVAKVKGDKAAADNAGLIILTIVGALGLLFLVAALACNLSCSGSGTAAVLVGVLGTAAIVWGVIAVVKAIKRGGGNKAKFKD